MAGTAMAGCSDVLPDAHDAEGFGGTLGRALEHLEFSIADCQIGKNSEFPIVDERNTGDPKQTLPFKNFLNGGEA